MAYRDARFDADADLVVDSSGVDAAPLDVAVEYEHVLSGRYFIQSDANYLGLVRDGRQVNVPCMGDMILEFDGRVRVPVGSFFRFQFQDQYQRFEIKPVFFSVSPSAFGLDLLETLFVADFTDDPDGTDYAVLKNPAHTNAPRTDASYGGGLAVQYNDRGLYFNTGVESPTLLIEFENSVSAPNPSVLVGFWDAAGTTFSQRASTTLTNTVYQVRMSGTQYLGMRPTSTANIIALKTLKVSKVVG